MISLQASREARQGSAVANTVYLALYYRIGKRILDISGALIGLVILALLLPAIALCIWWEDRGPIFYRQQRIGRYGRPFTMYKLRSMRRNADKQLAQSASLQESWQGNGKIKRDPRVTRIGALLRRSSLDELPQMWNVLCGQMSLVGPRAIQAGEMSTFGELCLLRHMVKPGLTGLWQISGRANTSYQQRAILDCMYVKECSWHTDLMILWHTFPVVVNGHGAY